MFNDDESRSVFDKMYEYSPADGFVEITEGLGEMIKSLANEPSVGLFYVQQHTHNAVPNLVNLRNTVVCKSREMHLHTEDSEDSIAMLRSMKECGFPVANEMIKDITKSLAIMSTKQPKRGLISRSVSGSETGRTSYWSPTTWGRNSNNSGETTKYMSIFKSAKQKASNLKWAQVDTPESIDEGNGSLQTSAASTSATAVESEIEGLPISSPVAAETQEKESEVEELLSNLSQSENFDEFKADKEAKLEEWLGGDDAQDNQYKGGTDTKEEPGLGRT